MTQALSIAIIGFGEVGQTLGDDLAAAGRGSLAAYDRAFIDLQSAPSRALAARAGRVGGCATAAAAVAGADLVISAVTADQAVAAAEAAAGGLREGAFFLDLNSCSPARKIDGEALIARAGGLYVEGAVMSPITPRRIASPILLGGPHASRFAAVAAGLGFTGAVAYSDALGAAAATKLCRSVVIKGIEALLAESLLAARRHGVEAAVLESLGDLLPDPNWAGKAQYMISRSLVHGARRAEEMHEAARTLAEVGVSPVMSEATAVRQAWAADFPDAASRTLADMLDALNAAAARRTP